MSEETVATNSILGLVMSLAAQEAIAASCAEITCAHLLIALSRVCDGVTYEGDSSFGGDVSREFKLLGIEPRSFRRRLRFLLGKGEATHPAGVIHRSACCRIAWDRAVRIAAEEKELFGAKHLVRELIASLGRDYSHDLAGNDQGSITIQDIPTEL